MHWAPGIPHALFGADDLHDSGKTVPWDRGSVSGRHCEARSDEAIQLSFSLRQSWIASRMPSSGAHSRDPLAPCNDDLGSLKIESVAAGRIGGTVAIPIA